MTQTQGLAVVTNGRKQSEIPGTERQRDEQLAAAADDLHDVRKRRMKLTEKEAAAAERLIEMMQEKDVDEYIDEELELRVRLKLGKNRVSVTQWNPEETASAGESE